MAEISLRTYIEEIDSLIERKMVDEAIAHCRHILSFYPKHLDTYRMLGKSLLEANRHGDAADIFQRVLSVVPDDFISHVGMSIVREDEANLDSALWHMERAFEANPANGAIQEELRRLYGRRDGVVPPKARLTRGALARMYTLGELFLQAEAELNTALSEDAERVDLETILAQVYWETEQPAAAAQVCSTILQKIPYSREANRTLTKILKAQGRNNEATPYQKRLEAVDPYEAYANGHRVEEVESEAVRLPRLDYTPGMEGSGAPDWVASIGMKFDEPAAAAPADQTPDWLRTEPPTPVEMPASSEAPSPAELPDWLRELQPTGTGATPSPMAEEPLAPAEAPDWLSELGIGAAGHYGPTEGEAAPAADQPMPDWLKTATGQLSPETMLDWMRPAEEAETTPEAAAAAPGESAEAQALPTDDLPNWMKAMAPAGDETQVAAPAEDLPEWMRTAAPDAAMPDWMRPAEEAAAEPTEPPASEAAAASIPAEESVPDWMRAVSPTDDEAPEWMQPALSRSPERSEGAVEGAVPSAEMPDWMRPAEEAATAPASDEDLPDWMKAALPPAEEIPDWMRPAAPTEATATEAATPTPVEDLPDWMRAAAPAADEMPEWMKAAAPAGTFEEAPSWMQAGAPSASEPVAEVGTAQPEVELPDFLQLASPEAIARAEQPATLEEEETATVEEEVAPAQPAELPNWLKAMAPEPAAFETPPVAASAPALADEAPPDISAMSDEEAMRWLEGLALQQGGKPEEMVALDQAEEEVKTPEWLRPPPETEEAPAANLPTWAEAAEPAASDTVVTWLAGKQAPDWLRQPGEEPTAPPPDWLREPAEEEAPEQPQALEPAELPDWLKAAQPAEAAEPSVAAPAEPVTPFTAEEPDLASMSADEALRWLENLAAQQGAAPEELVTRPEERMAEPSAWVATQPATTAEPEPIPPSEPASFEPPQPAPAMAPPLAMETPTAPAAEEPDFASMSADEALRWLENLAVQQGAAPEELVTRPEERIAEPPAWAAAQATTIPTKPEQAAPAPVEPDVEPAIAEEAPAAPTTEQADFASMSPDEALRWLEGLAEQQGAAPEELVTRPEERISEPPAWVAAQSAETEATLSIAPESAPAEGMTALAEEADVSKWLEGLAEQQPASAEEPITLPEALAAKPAAPVVAEASQFPSPAPVAPVEAPPVTPAAPARQPAPESSADDTTKLARLAERLAAAKRAKEDEIAARFEAQRAAQEAARQAVQEKMEQRKSKVGTGPLGRPGTGSLRPGTDSLPTATAPLTEAPQESTSPASTVPPAAEVTGPPKPKAPPSRAAARPRKGRAALAKSPFAAQSPEDVLVLSRQRLADGDYDGATAGLEYLVSTGQLVDNVIAELERFAPNRPGTSSLLRVLGDAYMRNNRLQKALDAYRQALGQL